MSKHSYQMSKIVALLSKHSQRATYGAVGGLVGLPARSVMAGQPKSKENSWVVAAKTGKPTGYLPGETDPKLNSRGSVISSPEDLASWLRSHS